MGCTPINKVKPISRDDTSDSTKLPHEVLAGFEKIMKASISVAKKKPEQVAVVITAKTDEKKAESLEEKSGERPIEGRIENIGIEEKLETQEKPVNRPQEKEKSVIEVKAEEVKELKISKQEVEEDDKVDNSRKNKNHFQGRSRTGIDQKSGNLLEIEENDEKIRISRKKVDKGPKGKEKGNVKPGTRFNHDSIAMPIEHKITTNSRLIIGEIKDDDSEDDSKEINYHDSMEKPLIANNESNQEEFRPAVFDFGTVGDDLAANDFPRLK